MMLLIIILFCLLHYTYCRQYIEYSFFFVYYIPFHDAVTAICVIIVDVVVDIAIAVAATTTATATATATTTAATGHDDDDDDYVNEYDLAPAASVDSL